MKIEYFFLGRTVLIDFALVSLSLAFEGDKDLSIYPKLIRKMEEYQFYSVHIYEHIPYKPSWPIVIHCAPHTSKLKIGPVTYPVFLDDPLTISRNLSVLNELAPGRTLIGISRGGYSNKLSREVKPSERSIKKVIETVEFIDNWQSNSKTAFEESQIDVKSARDSEILVGTAGPKLCAEACRSRSVNGIVVDALWNPNYARRMRDIINKELEYSSQKREEFRLIARPFTMISSDMQSAKKMILPILRRYIPELVGNSPMLESAGLTHKELVSDENRLEEVMENFVAVGSISDISEQVNQMLKAGVDEVCFGLPLGKDLKSSIDLLGTKLLPNFLDNETNRG
jgi:5,10-methylenetetrahydromethanopterin reductase